MYFVLVFIVNIIYLLCEIIFNTKLLDVSSGNFHYDEIESLEIFGRSLSTIGLSMLLIKIIQMLKIQLKTKIFYTILIVIFAHPVFFIGQKEAIDHISKQVPLEQQQDYYNTLLAKRAILSESKNKENMPFLINSNENHEKIFFSSLGLIKDEININGFYKKEDSINMIIKNESQKIAQELFDNYKKPPIENDTYEKYKKFQIRYKNNINDIKTQANKYYVRYTNDEARRTFFNQYTNTISKIEKGSLFFREKMATDVMNEITSISRCTNEKCFNSRVNDFEDAQRKIAQKYTSDKTHLLPTYSFYQFCVNNNSKANYTIINSIKDGESKTNNFKNRMGNYKKNSTLVCNFNLDTLGKNYEQKFRSIVKTNIDFSFNKYNSIEEFSLSGDFRKTLIYGAKKDGTPLSLPLNWNYKDKETFVTNASHSFIKKTTDEFNKIMKTEIGLIIPLNLSRSEFLDSGNLRKILKKQYKEDLNLIISDDVSYKSFFYENKNSLETKINKEIEDINIGIDEKSDIVKAMIIPPISLFLSAIFFLLNLILFIRNVFIKQSVIIANGLSISLFLVAFIFPFAHYFIFEHNLLIDEIMKHNKIKGFSYIWISYIESVIYQIGSPINEIINSITSKYLIK